jgi:demethylmenaquinone methyltransferase/2-methoxy-6-polyprenyl-1,4-benzoquinol methylase
MANLKTVPADKPQTAEHDPQFTGQASSALHKAHPDRSEQQGSPLGEPSEVEKTAQAVQSMFARVARRYDFLNHLLSAGCDLWWRHTTAERVRPLLEQSGSVAADLCCGTGDLTFALARLSSGRVIGADFCPPMLEIAREKRSRRSRGGQRGAQFLAADSLALPLPDNVLDLVSSAFGFRNLANYDRGLREMYRVLKPGGTLAILEFSQVSWPVIGPMFRFYFRHLLPLIGTLVSGERGPYQYLPESVKRFPDQESLARKLRESGFVNVCYQNFMGGVAALHLGEKACFSMAG